MEIAFLDVETIDLNGDMDFSGLRALGHYTAYASTKPEDVIRNGKNMDVLITNKVRIDREILNQLPELQHIAVIATGVDNVDTTAARERGVRVTNVSGYGKYTVPQHAFGLILALASRIIDYSKDVSQGVWQESDTFTLLSYPTFELAGKTIGIIGFGAIGRSVAEIAVGFRMQVRVHDALDFEYPPYENESLLSVLKNSDVVSIHAPLTNDTRNLIGSGELACMREGSLLINTGRGGIVDEEALLMALQKGHIGGAGLDVLAEEPPRENSLIARNDLNLIVTPHSAWSAREARQRLIDGVAQNIRSWQDGGDRNKVV